MMSSILPIKSKLFQLKEWLTIPEAAKHLSMILEEGVNETDVLRLVLDGHIKLSVNFINHTKARLLGKFLTPEEWEKEFREKASWEKASFVARDDGYIIVSFWGYDVLYPIEDKLWIDENGPWNIGQSEQLKRAYLSRYSPDEQEKFLSEIIDYAILQSRILAKTHDGRVPPGSCPNEENIITLKGIWDLPMLGAERLDIEHKFQLLTNGPEVTLVCLDGVTVEGQGGTVYQLQERFDQKHIDYMESEERIKESLEYYEKALKTKINNGELDEEEAKKLIAQRKKNLDRPRKPSDEYFPAGALPEDSVLVVRTKAMRNFLDTFSSEEANQEVIPFFDKQHPFHAKELKIAVEAWTELYEKNPPPHVPQGGHKKYITNWLEQNYPDLGQNAINRISTIINPNPKGGASPTG